MADDATPQLTGLGGRIQALLNWYRTREESGGHEDLDAFERDHPAEAAWLRNLRDELPRVEEILRSDRSLAARLEQKYGSGADRAVSANAGSEASSSASAIRDLVVRLAQRAPVMSRYRVEGEIARGGMGVIHQVWDEDLRRRLAMKVVLDRGDRATLGAAAPQDGKRLVRFLEEAQVTGQLDHPGIVPVHELGLDAQGRVFFTMKLVKGRDLKHVFELVLKHEEGWTQTRALSVMHKVCEAMAYAHEKGVIHRDLKPANVMVGDYGEVYVMDWGLARVAGVPDSCAVRLDVTALDRVSTDRQAVIAGDSDSSLRTEGGVVVGTPAFMSPEQAQGSDLDARSDVYALGAMLYQLLAGHPPYMPPGGARSPLDVILAIRAGPPAALAEIARNAAPELLAIAEKTMARDPGARYATMKALAEDLQRFLEGRVVRAHRTGAWIEFQKWVQRNRATAASLAGLVLAILIGLGAMTLVEKRNATKQGELNDQILGLGDLSIVQALGQRRTKLLPALPQAASDMEAWLKEARRLHERLPRQRESMAALLRETQGTTREEWLRTSFQAVIAALEALAPQIAQVDGWRRTAAGLEELTRSGENARQSWARAAEEIARSPRYGGLRIAPQLGLVPLGPHPTTGLWEFWHVMSGDEPALDPKSMHRVLAESSGIVLVLIPPGTTAVGGREGPEEAPYFDPWHVKDEVFFEGIRLDAYFLSKYETTQSQWLRVMEENPSSCHDAATLGSPLHPVEMIRWIDASEAARRLALVLPTETQWEHACRAGTTTPFSWGGDVASLPQFGNCADKRRFDAGVDDLRSVTPEIDDGQLYYGAVGSYRCNALGLFDMHGNLWEWCLDRYDVHARPRDGDGLRAPKSKGTEASIRGGSWNTVAQEVRSANRHHWDVEGRDQDLGVRFARQVDP